VGQGPGRALNCSKSWKYFSKTIKATFTKNTNELFRILCDQIVPDPIFVETDFSKELKVKSELLTNFYKRPATIDAAVLLPKEYLTEPSKKFPVLFLVFGFGGDYHKFSGVKDLKFGLLDSTACIRVFLDGNCPLGHSVYANSENNGLWGDALVEEFIPALEKQYRCNGVRLLTGHSSGGWAVLWLQTRYPKVFAGCWSSSPDPIDFRNFVNVNLYADKNMFYDESGELRPGATVGGRFPWIYTKDMYMTEDVISLGEQMHSFEAVFGKKGKDGKPERLCNPYTGEIDSLTISHWMDYDISLYLRTQWNKIKQYLDGKVRISVGEQDNFFLNFPVHLLDEEMKKLDSKFVFAYYPGDHLIVYSTEYRNAGVQFLEQKYKEWLEKTMETNK
jgi:S-formylglutathione hydrolase FrmB